MIHIGFFGMDTMGSSMAENVLTGGFEASVWNRSPAPGRVAKRRARGI